MSEYLWQPTQEQIERTNVWRFMQKHGFTDREAFLHWSVEHLEEFWAAILEEMNVEWFQPYTQVLDTSRGVEWAQWFTGGQLNVAHNCLDRWAQTDKTAIVWEGEDAAVRETSFRELAQEVSRVAAGFAALGLQKGDRVAICLPMTPEVVTVLYACARLGLILVPIFSGYGAGAIQTRLVDSGARVLITSDAIQRRGQVSALKERIEGAIEGTAVEHIIVWRYRGGEVAMQPGRDLWWDELPDGPETKTLPLDSETPLLLIYTSGTTGKPKGAVHTHAGALAQMAKEIYLGFDHKDTDRFFWLTDMGWMMGPWMIIGNHHFGGTIFLYDGAPDFPAADRLWDMIERHRLTTFGVSPTAIRLLMRSPLEMVERHDLSSLRLLGSTGEPWDDTSYRWYFEHVGGKRCPIINISGGTEIVGAFLFPLPIQGLTSCTLGGPAPGMAAEVVDEQGAPVRDGRKGYLVCTKPGPSMTRGLWGDPARYIETYWSRFPGVWHHGDWASIDADGLWYLHGRADESLKVAGRKVGPAEVEEACTAHPAISEAAVIGVPDELTGEAIVAFVVPKPGSAVEPVEVMKTVERILGPTLRPKLLRFVHELPKTQSGKIVRRAIRQKYLGEAVGDLSTVANPEALEQFA